MHPEYILAFLIVHTYLLIRIRGTWSLLNLSSLPETTHLRHLNPQGNRVHLLGHILMYLYYVLLFY
jgi:hypothetical protein